MILMSSLSAGCLRIYRDGRVALVLLALVDIEGEDTGPS